MSGQDYRGRMWISKARRLQSPVQRGVSLKPDHIWKEDCLSCVSVFEFL